MVSKIISREFNKSSAIFFLDVSLSGNYFVTYYPWESLKFYIYAVDFRESLNSYAQSHFSVTPVERMSARTIVDDEWSVQNCYLDGNHPQLFPSAGINLLKCGP